jgi:nucleoside-diphosphate-sugar epimerase
MGGGEVYNLVDDCPVSINDWVSYAAQLLHARPPLAVPLWLLGWTMPYVAQFSSARLPVSNAKSKRELGWQPNYPSYQDGLKAIVAGLNARRVFCKRGHL